jgi:hypothetical protein
MCRPRAQTPPSAKVSFNTHPNKPLAHLPPSKREQLLAQLRHKDEVIDTLLRQIHNPAMLTPLTFANTPSRLPTSQNPTQTRESIMAWVESASTAKRSQRASSPGNSEHGSASSSAFKEHRGYGADDDSDEDDDDEPATRDRVSPLPSPSTGPPRRGQQVRKPSSPRLHALPPPSAPIGLLADLALTNNKERRSADAMIAEADDEDAVGPANGTYFKPGTFFLYAVIALYTDYSWQGLLRTTIYAASSLNGS